MQTVFEYKIGDKTYKAAFNGKFIDVNSQIRNRDFFEVLDEPIKSGYKGFWETFYFGVIAADRLAERPDSITELEAENLFYENPKVFGQVVANAREALKVWHKNFVDGLAIEPEVGQKKSRSNSKTSKK